MLYKYYQTSNCQFSVFFFFKTINFFYRIVKDHYGKSIIEFEGDFVIKEGKNNI